MAYWISDRFWLCDKHVPSAKLPAACTICWYGCGTIRPAKPASGVFPKPKPVPDRKDKPLPTRTVPKVVEPALKKAEPHKVKAVPKVRPEVAKTVPKAAKKPPLTLVPRVHGDDGPSPAERRRGATQKVFCPVCGVALWRRPKDVDKIKVFYCSPEHRHGKNLATDPADVSLGRGSN